jgi:hypothetical protein
MYHVLPEKQNIGYYWFMLLELTKTNFIGRGMAQAVNRRLPTAAARVRARVRSCGICIGQSDTGAGFL